jgi:predicted DNA binding CopG/RHH family protein
VLHPGRPGPVPENDLSEPKGDQETQERGARMKKRGFHDDEERDLITAYERSEFRPVKEQQEAKQTAVHAAGRYMRKDTPVNIRLSTVDLEMLKGALRKRGFAIKA